MDLTTFGDFILKTAIKTLIYLVFFCVGYFIADALSAILCPSN